jgi:hypothetical protein
MSAVAIDIIAGAVVVIACAQLAGLIGMVIFLRRANQALAKFEQTATPILLHVDDLSREATEALSLVRRQLTRGERLAGDLAERVDRTVGRVQSGFAAPVRQAAALIAGALAVIRAIRRPPAVFP